MVNPDKLVMAYYIVNDQAYSTNLHPDIRKQKGKKAPQQSFGRTEKMHVWFHGHLANLNMCKERADGQHLAAEACGDGGHS